MTDLLQRVNSLADGLGSVLVRVFHLLALFVIGATIVWSAVYAFIGMAAAGHATVEDILLLFIYLELGAMVGIYFVTNHMPVRFLLYVAITALTRMLIGIVNLGHDGHEVGMDLIIVSGSILIVALATLVIRFGSNRYPSRAPVPPEEGAAVR